MKHPQTKISKPAMLCVVPPYTLGPPAGIAYMLGYAKQQGCHDFGFLDLRLGIPNAHAPTFSHTGVFGESYVMDVPDLPLVLSLVQAVETGAELTSGFPLVMEQYCRERGISAAYLQDYLTCLDQYFAAIAEGLSGVRFVGCSVWTSNFLTTLLFAAHLKRLHRPPVIVAGGPQLTESKSSAAIALRSRLLDSVVTGEGETALLDLYTQVKADGTISSDPLPGTITLGDRDEILRGPKRPLLPNNEIPLPSFEEMPLLAYQGAGRLRTVPFHLSRGCTDKCTFCSEWVFWERFRPGNALNTVEGGQELVDRYGVEYLAFTDSLLNGHPGRLRTFAEGMLQHGSRVKWGGFMRAEMDDETAALLQRAGCDTVFIGIESLSDETLELMNKRRTEPQNIRALRAFLGAGINVIAGCIPGFPGDPREAFLHTAEKLGALQHEYRGQLRVNVEPFIVSPGQPLFSKLDEVGLVGVPWDEEILQLAPRYRDVTDSMFCTVKGSNQGVERTGRLRIAEALESKEYSTRTDPFFYKGEEQLGRSSFEFQHLTAGWFMARLKGPASWIYSLIINEREQIEMTDPGHRWIEMLAAPEPDGLLERLESAHSIKPSRGVPPIVEGGYSRSQEENKQYQLTPYIVARQGDWRVKGRLIVVDFLNIKWWLRPQWHEAALKALQRRPQTDYSLQKELSRKGINRPLNDFTQLLKELAESGIAVSTQERATSPLRELRTFEPVNISAEIMSQDLPGPKLLPIFPANTVRTRCS
jgi:hypothetical protein